MKTISSLDNPEIKHIKKLHTKKGRDEVGQFLAEGARTVSTLLASPLTLNTLYVTPEHYEAYASTHAGRVVCITEKIARTISTASTPSGIIAVFNKPVPMALTAGLVLANVQDPGNVGTLMRTAAALNVKTIVSVEGCDPWHPKVIQASAGAIAYVSIVECSWQELLAKKGALHLCALVVEGGDSIAKIRAEHTLLVVGNEANGIPDAWLADCDAKATIPMPGHTESLNAAVAGSIALYLSMCKNF